MNNLDQHFTAALAALTFSAIPTGAVAQEALDRVTPNQAERREDMSATPPAKVTINVDATEPGATAGPAVLIGAVVLEGLSELKPADFADVMAKHVGTISTRAELAALATGIEGRARALGFPFATAWIEPQRMANGLLAVQVDEGRIDEIRFDGPAPDSVRRALAPLIGNKPARLDEVERRLLLTGDIDGVTIRSSRFFREKRRGILLVRTREDRLAVRAQLSNEGTRPLGPVQLRIDADANGVLSSDDVFSLTYSTTPTEPDELQFARARYARRVMQGGTELGMTVSGARTRPGAYLAPLDLESRSWFAGVDVLQPLHRQRRASLWLQGELGVRDLKQWRSDNLARHDRVTAARLTLYGYADVAGGRLRVSSTLSQGLGLFDATEAGDPLASRRDADGVFTSLSNWAEWTTGLVPRLSLRMAVQSQMSTDPLLVIEEAGLGGTAFLRGYDWSERSGDQAAMGMLEVRYMLSEPLKLMKRAQFYAFVDGGKVTNLGGGFGSGSLASTGGGVRADITNRMGVNIEVAVPVSGPRYDTGDLSPKLNFRLVRAF